MLHIQIQSIAFKKWLIDSFDEKFLLHFVQSRINDRRHTHYTRYIYSIVIKYTQLCWLGTKLHSSRIVYYQTIEDVKQQQNV